MSKFWRNEKTAYRRGGGLLLLAMLAVAVGGCRSRGPFGPEETGSAADTVRLRPGLVLSLSVLVAGTREIDEPSKRVTDGGTLMLPLLGEVDVTGQSLDELQQVLATRYGQFYLQPQVILDFARESKDGVSPWGFVTVLGRVKEPGRVVIPATRDLTVSGAIQQAGGFDSSAKPTAILVSRGMADGRTESRTINLHAVGAAGRLDEDIILQADDVVYIPERMF